MPFDENDRYHLFEFNSKDRIPYWQRLILGACLLLLIIGLMKWGDSVIKAERAETIRLKYERDHGLGPWADYPIVQKLQPMQDLYPTPENPIQSWTRSHARYVCETMGKLHRDGEEECGENVRGCMIRVWYLSQR